MDRLELAQELFVLEWGRMSSSWGINRTMAQIHALLFITGKQMTVDEIMDKLQISRGNASMNLRDLMDWGIVRRFRKPGERRDMYSSESDPWQMFARVVRERKRREIDPTAESIRECISKLPKSSEVDEVEVCRNRLTQLLEIFQLVDAVYEQAMATDQAFYATIALFQKEAGESR
jgi:DNA-binding transcriptional regulator GbsR (MarR family)